MLTNHKMMLADRKRCRLYQRAILEMVKPGDIVCDLGTGSGLLAFFALQAGAGKVYAIERSEIIDDAKRTAKDNLLDKKIIFIKKDSTQVNLPEKIDVLVSELIGYFALGEDLLKYAVDAKKRFLKKDGIVIPSSLDMFLAPVEAPAIYRREINFWSKKMYGIDFSLAKEEAVNKVYLKKMLGRQLLAKEQRLHSLDFYNLNHNQQIYVDSTLKFIFQRPGNLQGVVGWFSARLSPGVELSTSPLDKPTHWRNVFFPFREPLAVNKGDKLKVRLVARPLTNSLIWSWRAEISRKGCAKILFHQSMLKNINVSILLKNASDKEVLGI